MLEDFSANVLKVFNPVTPRVNYGDSTCSLVLTSESVDKILWCDHSNETSSAVLLHPWYHLFFNIYKMKFEIFPAKILSYGTLGSYWG